MFHKWTSKLNSDGEPIQLWWKKKERKNFTVRVRLGEKEKDKHVSSYD